jgi:NAD+--asparagine ADP-ribosyltransferase
MLHKEKLDIVLRGLYKYKFDGKYYSIIKIIEEQELAYGSNEPRHLAKRIYDDGYAKMISTKDKTSVCITSRGVEYCERDSYSFPGNSIVNIYNIHSTNTNFNTGSGVQNVISQSQSEIIKEIKEELNFLKEVDKTLIKEISECLDEIEEKISSNRKVSPFLFKGLLSVTADFATLFPLVQKLHDKYFL